MVSVVARQLHALLQLVVDVLLQFHFHGGVLELLISDQTAGACIIIILTKNCKDLFVLPLIHVDLMVLSQFKFIATQNSSQSITTHSNPHKIEIIEKAGVTKYTPSKFCGLRPELGSATGEMQSSVVGVVSVLPGTRLRRSHAPRQWMIDGIFTVSIDMSTTKSRQIIFFLGVSGSAYHEANELNPSCHGFPKPYP